MRYWFLLLSIVATSWIASEAASTNDSVVGTASLTNNVASTNDPVELEYQTLMETDDDAAAEIDGWILENQKFAQQGGGVPRDELIRRIQKRREPVHSAYQDFIKRHPNHGSARLAYASFLEDCGDMDGALKQMLKAKEVEPSNPAAWNNLANYYGHFGGVTNSFDYYQKAIDLDPTESVYYHNFGTTVYLFRKDAMQHYGITEQQVFDKALMLYSNALVLTPDDFALAADVAMTYYGINPPRNDEALKAWSYALKVAQNDLQRQGVLIHLGRIEMNAGNFPKAREYLTSVTNAELFELRDRVLGNLEKREHPVTDAEESADPKTSVGATNALPHVHSPEESPIPK